MTEISKKNNTNHPTVAVLMSTYNGEKYVDEQIRSILNQVGVSVTLYIRDDGSNDNTIRIIRKYKSIANVHIIEEDNNLGAAVAFMHLLYIVDGYDYYAFADQDDIWLTNKLSEAVGRLKKINGPGLYGSNQIIYMNGRECGFRYKSKLELSLVSELFSNHISGCTMVMNKELADALKEERSRPYDSVLSLRMHDTWVMTSALLIGTVVYDHNSYIRYRIHDDNTVGLKADNATIIKRISLAFRTINKNRDVRYRSKYAEELLRCFPNINTEDHYILRLMSEYKESFKAKVRLLNNKRIRKECGENFFALIMKVFFNVI